MHYEDLHPLVVDSLEPPVNRKVYGLSHHWSPSSITLVGSPVRAAVRERPVPSRSTTMSSLPSLKSPDTFDKDAKPYFPARKMRRIFSVESQRHKKSSVIFFGSLSTETKLPTALAPAHQGPHRCHVREWVPFAFRAIFHLGSQLVKTIRVVFRRDKLELASEKDSLHSASDYRTTDDDLNVPLQITIHLSSYVQWLLKNDLIKPAVALGFTNGILALEDITSQLERIKTTPIPSAYQDHLRLSLWFVVYH